MPSAIESSAGGGSYDGFLDELPGVDNHSCRLLGPTALIVQGLMGVLVILSLVYKRHREHPPRPWRIWLFDVSKQVVGQMFVHGVNVLASGLVAHHTSANACVFYFLNILIDTTLGVALIYLILHILTYFLSEKLQVKGFESGKYGTPPSITYWIRQAAIYVLSLTTMKFLVLGLLVLFPGIFKLGNWLLSWTYTGKGDSLQVIFTMGLFPIIMNVLQFWLIDSIVKASAANASLSLNPDAPDAFDPAREPLFRAPSDDEDEDGTGGHDIENPRPPPRSHTPPIFRSESLSKVTTGSTTPFEGKSSGSNTPGDSFTMHAYPPRSSSAVSTPSTSSSPRSSTSPKPGRKSSKRRSPPHPLNLLTAHQPAINSPQLSARPTVATIIIHPKVQKVVEIPAVNKEWEASWDDSDDWANRVGEEEWTGRRMEEKKETLMTNVWDSPFVHV